MAFEKLSRYLPIATLAAGAAVLCAAPARAQQSEPDTTQNFVRWAFPVAAQTAQAQDTPAQTAPNDTPDNKKRPKKFRLEKVLADMQRGEAEARQAGVAGSGDGFILIAESSVAQLPVTPPTETTTAATIEAQLDKLVKDLPHGARWVKLMLPPVPAGKTLKGDDLADFALAQARMYGSVGEAVLPPGSVEVLSQPLGSDKAKTVVPALNLRPVYLLVNPDAHYALSRQSSAIFTSTNGVPLQMRVFVNGTSGEVIEGYQTPYILAIPSEPAQP